MREFGDEEGLCWSDPIVVTKGVKKHARRKPPVPDTGWTLPESFPDLSGSRRIAVDVETHDPDLMTKGSGARRGGHIVGVAIGTSDGFRAYYPVEHEGAENCDKNAVYGWLREQLSDDKRTIVGANLLYDLDHLENEGVPVKGFLADVQIAEPLLDENKRTYNLESLAQHHLNEGKEQSAMDKWAMTAFGCTKRDVKSHMKQIPPKLVGPYAMSDVDLPLRILEAQIPLLKQDGLMDLFVMESELLRPLLKMRKTGVRINADKAYEVGEAFDKKYKQAKIALEGAGEWEADALACLFDKKKIDYPRTSKGAPSFTKGWLEQQHDPLCNALLEARRYQKMSSTFVDGYLKTHNINGRVHAEFNPLRSDDKGTVSGRFSSNNPNLQNIPSRDPELGPLIRSLFIPEEGCLWWKLDWSQIEYRLIVHFANLYKCKDAIIPVSRYNDDPTTDFHEIVAQMVGVDRKQAKNLNFGMAYGQGVALLASILGLSMQEAETILKRYHKNAPFIKELSNLCMAQASGQGFITTLMGRRRRFDKWEKRGYKEGKDRNLSFLKQEAAAKWGTNNIMRAFTYSALNSLCQGSAADIMKRAMVDIYKAGIFDVLPIHLTVHDELDGSLPDTPIAREAFAEVKHIMETCVRLSVPLIAEGGTGPHWGAIN